MKTNPRNVLSEQLRNYLSDLIYSFRQWATRFTPLAIDLNAAGIEFGRIFSQSTMRRGMGIIEAECALRRFVLLGEPGSGKSTSLQYLAMYYAQKLVDYDQTKDTCPEPAIVRIPVYLELNMYKPAEHENGILSMLKDMFYPYFYSDRLPEMIEQWLRDRKLLIILDGLNECPRRYCENMLRDIKSFLNKFPALSIIISCRTRDYAGIFQLSALSIRHLSERQIERFIIFFFQDVRGKERKIEKFKSIVFEHYSDISRTPLLVKIILDVYHESSGDVLLNRGTLMRRFFELWINREAVKQGKNISTARTIFLFQLLGSIAYKMQNLGEIRASREAVFIHIGDFLEKYIDSHRVGEDEYHADRLLEEFLGMGLFDENDARIKFHHQMFQEFFAGYQLVSEDSGELDLRMGKILWEGPLKFYAGITDNASLLIETALENNDTLGAAQFLAACQYCDTSLVLNVYRGLFELIFDKFSSIRKRASGLLSIIPDKRIDTLLQDCIDNCESNTSLLRYSEILSERERIRQRQAEDIQFSEGGGQDTPKVSDYTSEYTGSVFQLLRRIERLIKEEGIEAGKVMLTKAVGSLGGQIVSRALLQKISNCGDPNKLLFAVWGFAVTNEKRGTDVIFQEIDENDINEIFPDLLGGDNIQNPEAALLFKIVFNKNIYLCWQLEIAEFDLLCAEMPGKEKVFARVMQKKLERDELTGGHLEFLLQIFWDMSPEIAELNIMQWVEGFINKPVCEILLQFLSRYGVGSGFIDKCRTLLDAAPENLKHYFPEILAKTGSKQVLGFLMNIVKSIEYPLDLRSAALTAMRWSAGPSERVFLQELRASDIPELYDPAFEVLEEVERRLQLEDKMIFAESADDMSLEILFDEESEWVSGKRPAVVLFKEDMQSPRINGKKIHFGPVSGRLFYYLGKNSTLGKYHTVQDIQSYMKLHDLYMDDTAVRNRITDIRTRIGRELEGRIDPNKLLENARRYGYRINAAVDVK